MTAVESWKTGQISPSNQGWPVVTGPAIMNNPRTEPLLRSKLAMVPSWSGATQPPRSAVGAAGEDGATPTSDVTDEALFLANLPVIDDVVRQICRRHRLSAAEADDFRSDVRLHFIDRNYDVLRRFEGRSSLATYITVVIQRQFLDHRNHLWGKWRPSAEARRLGPIAILLERLVIRDGWTSEQALETLRVNHGVAIDAPLRTLCEKLAQRSPARRLVPEEEAEDVSGPAPSPEANVVRAEHGFLARRVRTALDRARQPLTPEERLILKMRFEDRVPVADIARALHLNQRRLYRTIERLLTIVRENLAVEGIAESDVRTLLDDEVLESSEDAAVDANAGPASRPAERMRTSWRQK
jgi:RNA polymerase sigma factor (sigma-70 family)